MRLQCTIRRHHRPGESPDDCADHIEIDPGRGVLAVADGVGTALYASQWSSRLCAAAMEAMPARFSAGGLATWLEPLRLEMTDRITAMAAGKPWYVAAKAREGASSTLLLGQYEACEEGLRLLLWNVGDCNLVQARADGKCFAWPVADPDKFGLRPPQLGSHPAPVEGFRKHRLPVGEGDLLVIATDAVAKWLLQELFNRTSGERRPWLDDWASRHAASDEAWAAWVEDAREHAALEADDASALVIVHLPDTADAPLLVPLPAPSAEDTVPPTRGDSTDAGQTVGETRPIAPPPPVQATAPAAEATQPPEPAPDAPDPEAAEEPAESDADDDLDSSEPLPPPRLVFDPRRLAAWRQQVDVAVSLNPEVPSKTGDPSYRIISRLRALRAEPAEAVETASMLLRLARPGGVELPAQPEWLHRLRGGERVIPDGEPTLGDLLDAFGLNAVGAVTQLLLLPDPLPEEKKHQRLLVWQSLSLVDPHLPGPPPEAVIFSLIWACWRRRQG